MTAAASRHPAGIVTTRATTGRTQPRPLHRLLLTYPDLRTMVGIRFSRQHITRLMAKGQFPKPIRLGGDANSTYSHWRAADILDWIEQRAAASGLPPRRLEPPAPSP